MDAASETGSQELIPDSGMASDLISARGPAPFRKLEFEDVGTGHNDQELPEADLGADDILWEDSYLDDPWVGFYIY